MTDLVGDIAAPYALIMTAYRSIGTIMPNVVVEEVHRDMLAITEHPVERGAPISDHAFHIPSEVEMRCGWSNSTAMTEGYVQEVYQELLALQNMREPFDVYTGKRAYVNMLMRSIIVETNETSEYALNVTVHLREVIITDTQGTAPSNDSQALMDQTSNSSNFGNQTAIPAPNAPTLNQAQAGSMQ